jgi:hypothetical protein
MSDEALTTVVREQAKVIERFQAALQEIRDTQGKVCTGYELCDHIACQSSYTAWVIADTALHPDFKVDMD